MILIFRPILTLLAHPSVPVPRLFFSEISCSFSLVCEGGLCRNQYGLQRQVPYDIDGKKSRGGYVWVEAVGHSVGVITGTKLERSSNSVPLVSPMSLSISSSTTSSSSSKVASHRMTLVFSEQTSVDTWSLSLKWLCKGGARSCKQ